MSVSLIGRCEPSTCLICDNQSKMQQYGCDECGVTWHCDREVPCSFCSRDDGQTDYDLLRVGVTKLEQEASEWEMLAYTFEHIGEPDGN